MKIQTLSQRAFSMLEVLIVIGVIGIIAAIAVPSVGNLSNGVKENGLVSDVATINRSIQAYLATGGDLKGISDPQVVLDKLKTRNDSSAAKISTTFSGSMIDKRLAVQYLTKQEKLDSNVPRAVWDKDKMLFKMVESGKGISQFFLDDTLAEVDYGTETRDPGTFNYNKNAGWVWKGVEKMPETRAGITTIGTTDPTSSSPAAIVQSLDPPQIYPASGEYPESASPLNVSLYNPNPSGTWMLYSLDGGPFKTYGGPFQITADTTIVAFTEGDPEYWTSSVQASNSWTFKAAAPPTTLASPLITLSSNEFNENTSSISYSLANPNPPGSSDIFFVLTDINAPVPPRTQWSLYQGSSSAEHANYPDGFRISAYAKARQNTNYLNSNDATATTGSNFFGLPTAGDVLFVLDGSGSMNGNFGSQSRWEAVVQETISSINSLTPADRFGVVVFSSSLKYNSGNILESATQENKDTVISALQGLSANGGTNYQVALSAAMNFNPLPSEVFMLSDGQPNSQNYSTTTNQLQSAGIIVNTIGFDVNNPAEIILTAIANLLGGSYVNISQ
ncbi:MAG: VWA domain-containing protein [Verrucomicrobiales bacterium]|nr:VWA domain-containing protein [Verrucomicrobiales bacterium]